MLLPVDVLGVDGVGSGWVLAKQTKTDTTPPKQKQAQVLELPIGRKNPTNQAIGLIGLFCQPPQDSAIHFRWGGTG